MLDAAGAGELLLVARLLFGGTLAFTGVNHFLDTDSMAGYAEFKGIPAPRASVLLSGGLLLFGGLSLVAGVYPTVGAGGIAVFLLVSGVTMHDFWAADGEDRQTEMTQFLKNVYGSGAALAFLVAASVPWPYALNVGL